MQKPTSSSAPASLKALEGDAKGELLIAGLREKESELWGDFLDELESR
jgi:hypothetical protein